MDPQFFFKFSWLKSIFITGIFFKNLTHLPPRWTPFVTIIIIFYFKHKLSALIFRTIKLKCTLVFIWYPQISFDSVIAISTFCLLLYLKMRRIKGPLWSPTHQPTLASRELAPSELTFLRLSLYSKEKKGSSCGGICS